MIATSRSVWNCAFKALALSFCNLHVITVLERERLAKNEPTLAPSANCSSVLVKLPNNERLSRLRDLLYLQLHHSVGPRWVAALNWTPYFLDDALAGLIFQLDLSSFELHILSFRLGSLC